MAKSKWIVRKDSKIDRNGVFAAQDIPVGTFVVEYTGQRLTKAQTEKKKNHDYIFELNKKYDIDGRNIARYVNHSCEPNCETDVIKGKIWIIAAQDIEKGEELTYNYGYSIKDGIQYPCRCGAEHCPGYILDYDLWPKFKKLVEEGKIKLEKA